jgi:cysteinyl-tRNA synthetase
MSKSLGNLVLVRDVLDNYSSDALRLYLFSHHYRGSWEYRDDELDEWARLAADLQEAVAFPAYGIEEEVDVSVFRERFLNALDDDLDTPSAIDALRAIGRSLLEAPEEDDVREAQRTLRELAGLLGLTLSD